MDLAIRPVEIFFFVQAVVGARAAWNAVATGGDREDALTAAVPAISITTLVVGVPVIVVEWFYLSQGQGTSTAAIVSFVVAAVALFGAWLATMARLSGARRALFEFLPADLPPKTAVAVVSIALALSPVVLFVSTCSAVKH